MEPSDPVAPVAPLSPAGPAGPAGPWTGTVTTAGLSHALKASAIIAAVITIEYFMGIPFNCQTKTAVLKLIAAIPNCELPVDDKQFLHPVPFANVPKQVMPGD